MSKKLSIGVIGTVLLLLGLSARATVISFDAIDLTDTGIGDLWQYDYTVHNNGPVDPLQQFRIFFSLDDYENLAIGAAPAGWDPLVIQPGSLSGLNDGYYDVLDLGPGLPVGASAGLFSVQFDWIGAGTPGAQAFTIYDPVLQLDPLTNRLILTELDTGFTTPSAIPLPAAVWLFGTGIAGLMVFSRRKLGQQ